MPIILGDSKWKKTPYELWRDKLGFTDGSFDNWAMQKGREMEPIILEMVNLEMQTSFKPCVIQHSLLDFAAASLDGLDLQCGDGAILEIKYAGKEDHETAKNGEVPSHYRAQIQWQLFVSDLEVAFYASYNQKDLVIIKVEKDYDYIIEKLIPAASQFHSDVMSCTEPKKEERDCIYLTASEIEKHTQEYKQANAEFKAAEARLKQAKDTLLGFTDDSTCEAYGVKMTRVQREGNVKWQKLFEDIKVSFPEVCSNFNIEDYRSDASSYWKFSEK